MSTLLSVGLYSVPGAARLIGSRPNELRRWAFGYRRRGKPYSPAIRSEIGKLGGEETLTFLNLVELLFIHELRRGGHSFLSIRKAGQVLRKVFKTHHPFALRTCFADPAGIYALIEAETGDDLLVELQGNAQLAMWPALQGYLKQLDFNVDELAERWHPQGRGRPVVVDPKVAFGAPVILGTATETAVIYEMYSSERSLEEIALWYDLELAQVREAIEFEERLAA